MPAQSSRCDKGSRIRWKALMYLSRNPFQQCRRYHAMLCRGFSSEKCNPKVNTQKLIAGILTLQTRALYRRHIHCVSARTCSPPGQYAHYVDIVCEWPSTASNQREQSSRYPRPARRSRCNLEKCTGITCNKSPATSGMILTQHNLESPTSVSV